MGAEIRGWGIDIVVALVSMVLVVYPSLGVGLQIE